jgi:hypothetical protein
MALHNIINIKGSNGRPTKINPKKLVDAIMYRCKTGISYRMLSEQFGCDFRTLNRHVIKISSYEIIKLALQDMLSAYRASIDTTKIIIDSTFITNAYGVDMRGPNFKNRGRLNTKVSCIVSKNGILLGCCFEKANAHDAPLFIRTYNEMLIKIKSSCRSPVYILGDAAYDSSEIRSFIKSKHCYSRIPHNVRRSKVVKKTAPYRSDKDRLEIERYFAHIKKYKTCDKRQDRESICFESNFYLASLDMYTKKLKKHEFV